MLALHLQSKKKTCKKFLQDHLDPKIKKNQCSLRRSSGTRHQFQDHQEPSLKSQHLQGKQYRKATLWRLNRQRKDLATAKTIASRLPKQVEKGLRHRFATPPSGISTPPESLLPRPSPESTFVCAFCSRANHYTSDCWRHKRLSERVQLAVDEEPCINCVKHHRSICVGRDPCSKSRTEGDHRAFCIDNPRAILDNHETRSTHHRWIAEQTFRPYPGPMEDQPPH